MLKCKKPFVLLLSLMFLVGISISSYATETLTSSPNIASDPNWDLKEASNPTHVDSEVPLVGDPGQGIDHEQAELDRMTSKTSTYKPVAVPTMDGFADFVSEGFEGGVMPPTGWSVINNNPYTWAIASDAPYEGSNYGTVVYDETYSGNQDEWLISPDIDLTGVSDAVLDFWWNGSYYWSVDPYPNCTLSVFVSTDGGANWSYLWSHNDAGLFTNWEWYNAVLDLSAYVDETINIAFIYTGYDGAQFSVDAISVNNDPLPTGRCCYGDPLAPTCDVTTEEACNALGDMLSWDEGMDCTTPCDVPPPGRCCYGDPLAPSCSDITEIECNDLVDMLSWSGDLDCTTPCPVAGPGDNCANPLVITLPADFPYADYGQFTCSRGDDYAAADMCYTYGYGGGEDIVYELVITEETTIQMMMDPKGVGWWYVEIRSECIPPAGDCIYYFKSTVGDPMVSDNVILAVGTYYIIIDTWPSPDCLTEFDFTIQDAGAVIGRCCYGDPGAPSCDDITESDCINLGGEWDPTTTCAADPCPIVDVGDNCQAPIEVKVPGDLPYADDNYTCGRQNFYNETCLGSYDGGEEIVYWLDVDSPVDVDILLDPRGTTYTGIAIGDACPLPSGTGDCIDKSTSSSSAIHGVYNVHLEPGSYYVMIDTWPSPDCIPDLGLSITVSPGGPENDDWDKCDEIGEVTDYAFNTAQATADGPLSCQTAPNLWYCYTPSCDGEATATLCGSSYDTKMAVYDGTDPFTAVELDCNDDSDCPTARALQSTVTWLATAGNTYLIEVGGYSSNTGPGVLSTFCDEDTCSVPNPQDNCADVTPAVLTLGTTHTFTGNNGCATNEAPTVFDDNGHIWEAFTITADADVAIDYCGTTPSFDLIYVILLDACPAEAANSIFADATDWSVCGDGNVTMYFPGLPAGTYYLPILSDHPDYPSDYYEGPYTINVLASSANLTYDPPAVDFGLVAPGSTGGMGLILGVDGSRDVNWEVDIIWGDKSRSTNHENNSLGIDMPEKPPYDGPVFVPGAGRAGGETIATATVIPGLPYTDNDNTCTFLNDYDEVCPYSGGTAPDAVYQYTPAADEVVDISLCNSAYDTKLYLYENTYTPGAPYACNDDECPGYMSALYQLPLTGGNTYYIVVDGYGSACGDYQLDMTVFEEPDPFECPLSAFDEAEACGDDTNGGCNMTVPAFEPINCNDTVCGTVWADGGSRDTDWYLLSVYEAGPITWTATAQFPLVIGFVETAILGDPDCASASALNPYATGNPGDVISVTLDAVPGDYWLFVSHSDYYDYPCGTNNGYWATPECDAGSAPILWLSVGQNSGVVPAGGTFSLPLNYDVGELPDGVHTAQLLFTHDGNKTEDIVPVQIEVGNLGNNILTLEPDTIFAIMQYSYNDSLNAEFYLGGEFGGGGHVVGDVDQGAGVNVNGSLPMETYEVLPSYEGFTGEVLKMTCKMSDFVVTYPLLWDIQEHTYYVEGAFTAGGTFYEEATKTMRGHTSGDANFDGNVNLLDITYLIAYVYMGGAEPRPIPQTGDADGSGAWNILDVTRIISYLYQNGPAPTHP